MNYFEQPLTADVLSHLLQELNYTPKELIRTTEAIWKSDYKGKDLTEKELIQAMVKHPKLMERPIISNGKKAVIARPIEKLMDFLK